MSIQKEPANLESYKPRWKLCRSQISGKFNMKHRLISAGIALPLVLTGIFLGGIWFSFIIIFGSVVSAYELAKMTGTDQRKAPFISASLSGILVGSVYLCSSYLFGNKPNSWELQTTQVDIGVTSEHPLLH